MRGLRLVLAVLLASATLACDPPPPSVDGGQDDGGPDARSASRAVVSFGGEDLAPSELSLETLSIHVASMRLVGDRGAALDPVIDGVGPIELTSARSLAFEDIPPASYSAVVVVLDGAAVQLALEGVDEELGRVRVRFSSRLEWMARCSSGAPVRLGEHLDVRIELDLHEAWSELREAELPAPEGGVIIVDEARSPEVIATFLESVGERIRASCERR